MKYAAALLAFALFAVPTQVSSQEKAKAKGHDAHEKHESKTARAHKIVAPDDITWTAAPPSLPAGARAAVLSGDPSKGGVFTMRLSLPDGYRIPPHFHAADEHVTVISGEFRIGMGDRFDESQMTSARAGTLAVMPKGMRHFVMARGQTVVQVHAMGPWKLTYVNKADDPRTTVSKK